MQIIMQVCYNADKLNCVIVLIIKSKMHRRVLSVGDVQISIYYYGLRYK